jgi:hypothetical protein
MVEALSAGENGGVAVLPDVGCREVEAVGGTASGEGIGVAEPPITDVNGVKIRFDGVDCPDCVVTSGTASAFLLSSGCFYNMLSAISRDGNSRELDSLRVIWN